jgi:hypothetical protein
VDQPLTGRRRSPTLEDARRDEDTDHAADDRDGNSDPQARTHVAAGTRARTGENAAVYGRGMRVPTAAVTAGSLIGGWQLARRTGNRSLGGAVLLAGGVVAGREWARRTGPAVTGALVVTYLGAFGLSHPLARRIGAWPSVLTVAAMTAAASYAASDRRPA